MSLHYNGRNRHKCEEDDDLSPFNVPLYLNSGLVIKKFFFKTMLFERPFGQHPLI